MSLLLTIDPETSDAKFTEADLKPGLKVIRKRDGAECVVQFAERRYSPWSISCSGRKMMRFGVYSNTLSYTLDWLNADFRRPSHPRGVEKPLKDVEPKNWFVYKGQRYIKGSAYSHSYFLCWNVSSACESNFTVDCPVRDLGPVRIDKRILEGK